jgi:UDPglucose 6-dehydrogenase
MYFWKAFMQITVIGTGYVGLVCGACFASFGHKVICVDTDARKIDELNAGRMPIFEPGLQDLVTAQRGEQRLAFTTNLSSAIPSADFVFLTVGTPSLPNGRADLSFMYQCAAAVATHLRGYTAVVIKSTVPLGTADEIEAIIRSEHATGSWSVISNPEFLREGAAISDFLRPDRVVIGTEDERARQLLARLYRPLRQQGVPMVFTSRRTAELIKYAANGFLATKIAYMGEIADLCEKADADFRQVALGVGLDQRIGRLFLQAGPGYGGSCFPKDAAALVATAQQFGASPRILPSAIAANETRKRAMVDKVVESCGGSVRGKRIAILGLTFKPGTDDVREAPSLVIIPRLEALGARVRAYDPAGMVQARKVLPRLRIAKDAYACTRQCDAIVIMTDWEQFRALDLERIKAGLRTPVLIDLRNLFEPDEMVRHGFEYTGIGVPALTRRAPARSAETLPSVLASRRSIAPDADAASPQLRKKIRADA